MWHREQRRKYPEVLVPYVSHPAGVVAILARHGFDEEVLAAGALHDVVEDCGVTYEQISVELGPRVADLVRHVSEEDKSLPWEERKARYLEHFKHKPWDAQAISLADKIDNFTSIVVCKERHGDPWGLFKRGREAQLARFDDMLRAARALPPHPLIDEYEEALDQVRSV